jgi:hypothetical protein
MTADANGVVPLHGWRTTPEMAWFLSFSTRTLQRWRAAGTGPPWFRVGRFVRYGIAQVQRWLDEECAVPALPPPGAWRRRQLLHLVPPPDDHDDGT